MAQLIITNPALVDRLMRAAVKRGMNVETLLDHLVVAIDDLGQTTEPATPNHTTLSTHPIA